MKFGKVENLEDVDFRMPDDPARNEKYLGDRPRSSPAMPLYIGCTGWSMKEWVGTVYPPGTKSHAFLEAYGRQFNTIELNTTHYRIPTRDTIQKWVRATPTDFRFCPKVPQVISHRRDLGLEREAFPTFLKALQFFGEKLGCAFLQLPPHFGPDRWPLLQKFVQQWPRGLPLAIEFRQPDWFGREETSARFEWLDSQGCGSVITDVAGRRDVMHMQLCGPAVVIRFVGNGLIASDYARAADWVARLESWAKQGLNSCFFFPHQPDNLRAPEIAAWLTDQFRRSSVIDTRGPILNQHPAQTRLFE